MSEENNRVSAYRKKRVQTLKKLIILILVISIMIPCVCCVVLFVKVRSLNDTLLTTTIRLDEMSRLLLEQQSLFERYIAETDTLGEGTTSVNETAQGDEVSGSDNGNGITGVVKKEGEHKVYLTFDDGPSIYTDEILDILDQYDIKATFFVVGKEDDDSKEAIKQIVERDHSLGMHSYSHKYKEIYKSVDSFADDFMKIQDYLYDLTGVRSYIYRFPGGSSNKVSDLQMQEFADYLQEQNITFYDWNISSGDGGSVLLSVQDLVDNCTRDIESLNTSIILLHDSGDKRTTVEALPVIIENILALEDTVILPITEETEPVQHINSLQTKVKE